MFRNMPNDRHGDSVPSEMVCFVISVGEQICVRQTH